MLRPLCARWAYGSGTDAHPEHMHQLLTRMLSMRISFRIFQMFILYTLSMRIRNWCVHWACASGADACTEHARKELMRMLSICISSWPVCSGYASVPGAYAQHFLKGMRSVYTLVSDAYAQCTHQFLTRMLSVRISSCRACSVHASIPYAHAEGIQNEHLKNRKTDAHAEHVRKELIHMLRVRISSWRACSGCASVPDTHAQGAHQFLTRTLRVRISSWPVCSACA